MENWSELYNQNVEKIFKVFSDSGYEVRIVGGCVRDAILNSVSDDIDFATNAKPDAIQKILKASKIHYFDSGLKHGTITAIFEKTSYEITTLRCDKECDGRHAVVEFTEDWMQDASRRDFTFNALYLDASGKLYDYFNGINHLKSGVLNYIGKAEARIKEDYLRILRAFRFQNKYCIQPLDEIISSAIKKYSHQISTLSGERIQSEIVKLLQNFHGQKTIDLLHEFNTLNISEEVFLRKNINYEVLKNIQRFTNPWFYLGFLIRYNNLSLSSIKKRWQISNKNSQIMLDILNIKIENDFPFKPRKYLYNYYDIREVFLACLDYEKPDNQFNKREFLSASKPIFSITPKILMERGYRNKEIGDNLRALTTAWLDSNCENHDLVQ